jgi:hypothetical protein
MQLLPFSSGSDNDLLEPDPGTLQHGKQMQECNAQSVA